MKAGNRKFFSTLLILFFITSNLHGEERVNLNILQPTFEEEAESTEEQAMEKFDIKSRKKNVNINKEPFVKFRALDKITAKTQDMNVVIGKKKRFGYLEILPKKCDQIEDQNNKGVAAYIQVRDLSDKKEENIFVFNGWTFSTSTNLKTFDHPIYDLWVTGCENI